MGVPLQAEVAVLESQGLALQLFPQPDRWTCLVIQAHPLPAHFNRPTTDLLIKVPPLYPYGALDMFWTTPDLRLSTGAMPAGASPESVMGRQWLRFSWHPATWRQGVDNVCTFLNFINQRLHRGD